MCNHTAKKRLQPIYFTENLLKLVPNILATITDEDFSVAGDDILDTLDYFPQIINMLEKRFKNDTSFLKTHINDVSECIISSKNNDIIIDFTRRRIDNLLNDLETLMPMLAGRKIKALNFKGNEIYDNDLKYIIESVKFLLKNNINQSDGLTIILSHTRIKKNIEAIQELLTNVRFIDISLTEMKDLNLSWTENELQRLIFVPSFGKRKYFFTKYIHDESLHHISDSAHQVYYTNLSSEHYTVYGKLHEIAINHLNKTEEELLHLTTVVESKGYINLLYATEEFLERYPALIFVAILIFTSIKRVHPT